ncbi:50S ribosomal protein L9 [soil metagenome]
MPATIQVVLQHDVDNVGKSGELVKVRPGYARNFLIPRSLAVPATTAAVNRISHDRAVAVARAEKLKKEFKDIAAKSEGLTVTIARPVGEDDRLFGSVTLKDIHAAVTAKGFDIDRKKMHLADPIKALGTFDVPVKLMADVIATIKVEVVKE